MLKSDEVPWMPMSMKELQDGLGATGKFGEGFLGLGILSTIIGGAMAFMGWFMVWPEWNTGSAVHTDSLISGALFLVMGIGFTVFAVMIMLAGWARHHPGFDERGMGLFHHEELESSESAPPKRD